LHTNRNVLYAVVAALLGLLALTVLVFSSLGFLDWGSPHPHPREAPESPEEGLRLTPAQRPRATPVAPDRAPEPPPAGIALPSAQELERVAEFLRTRMEGEKPHTLDDRTFAEEALRTVPGGGRALGTWYVTNDGSELASLYLAVRMISAARLQAQADFALVQDGLRAGLAADPVLLDARRLERAVDWLAPAVPRLPESEVDSLLARLLHEHAAPPASRGVLAGLAAWGRPNPHLDSVLLSALRDVVEHPPAKPSVAPLWPHHPGLVVYLTARPDLVPESLRTALSRSRQLVCVYIAFRLELARKPVNEPLVVEIAKRPPETPGSLGGFAAPAFVSLVSTLGDRLRDDLAAIVRIHGLTGSSIWDHRSNELRGLSTEHLAEAARLGRLEWDASAKKLILKSP
jgi:hypothetical protein